MVVAWLIRAYRWQPARKRLPAAARRRKIDVVLVWRLDRWGRSLFDLVVTLKELAAWTPIESRNNAARAIALNLILLVAIPTPQVHAASTAICEVLGDCKRFVKQLFG